MNKWHIFIGILLLFVLGVALLLWEDSESFDVYTPAEMVWVKGDPVFVKRKDLLTIEHVRAMTNVLAEHHVQFFLSSNNVLVIPRGVANDLEVLQKYTDLALSLQERWRTNR